MNSSVHSFEDKLLEFAYGELPMADARAVEAHLKGCPKCTGALESIRGVRSTMAKLAPEPAPDAGLESLLAYAQQSARRAKAGPEPKHAPWRRWLLVLGSVSALGLVAVVANHTLLRQVTPTAMMKAAEAPPAPVEVARNDLSPVADLNSLNGAGPQAEAAYSKKTLAKHAALRRDELQTMQKEEFAEDAPEMRRKQVSVEKAKSEPSYKSDKDQDLRAVQGVAVDDEGVAGRMAIGLAKKPARPIGSTAGGFGGDGVSSTRRIASAPPPSATAPASPAGLGSFGSSYPSRGAANVAPPAAQPMPSQLALREENGERSQGALDQLSDNKMNATGAGKGGGMVAGMPKVAQQDRALEPQQQAAVSASVSSSVSAAGLMREANAARASGDTPHERAFLQQVAALPNLSASTEREVLERLCEMGQTSNAGPSSCDLLASRYPDSRVLRRIMADRKSSAPADDASSASAHSKAKAAPAKAVDMSAPGL